MYTKKKSSDGTVRLDFDKGHSAVIIPSKNDKTTICLSSQIGCPIQCEFCHTGKFIRNLTTEEITEQFTTCKSISQKLT